MTGNGQNKPAWSSRTTGGEMDTRSTDADMDAAKVKPHSERAAGKRTEKTHSPEAAGAFKDQVGKSG